jgi:hypothetical protein
MIYCVVPQALANELYDKLVEYYKDDPNVEVIVDRRAGPDRRNRPGVADAAQSQRVIRDRRQQPLTGTTPSDVPSG